MMKTQLNPMPDNPNNRQTTIRRKTILLQNTILRKIYLDWYAALAACLPAGRRAVLELGSGAGFLKTILPGAITSDILRVPGTDLALDGTALPFPRRSLDAVLAIDVLHHIPQPRAFFSEAARCVRPGGAIALIEPWVTPWSRLVYGLLHHEPFAPQASTWEFVSSSPLYDANLALPWIILHRDRARFESEFPQWQITAARPFMPLRYLASGGFTRPGLMPAWSDPCWRSLEGCLSPLNRWLAMFALITLERSA